MAIRRPDGSIQMSDGRILFPSTSIPASKLADLLPPMEDARKGIQKATKKVNLPKQPSDRNSSD